jgi:hypothetical protein
MRIIIISFIILAFAACDKSDEYPQPFPVVITKNIGTNADGKTELIGNIRTLGTGYTVISHGFVWTPGLKISPALLPAIDSKSSAFVEIDGDAAVGRFSKVMTADFVKGVMYVVRAYVKTDKAIIYGNPIIFQSNGSLPFAITSVDPMSGFEGAEITISGSNFGVDTANMKIRLGTSTFVKARIISHSEAEVKFKVPFTNEIGDVEMYVSNATSGIYLKNKFTILGPKMKSLSSVTPAAGDVITIDGEYFDKADGYKIAFEDHTGQTGLYEIPAVLSSTQLQISVPGSWTKGKVSLSWRVKDPTGRSPYVSQYSANELDISVTN